MVGHELKRQEGRRNFNLIKLHVWDLVGTRFEIKGDLEGAKDRLIKNINC